MPHGTDSRSQMNMNQETIVINDTSSDESSIDERNTHENDPLHLLNIDVNPHLNVTRSFRRCNDLLTGCANIDDVIGRLRSLTLEYQNLQRYGWDLQVPVRDTFVYIVRAPPLSPD